MPIPDDSAGNARRIEDVRELVIAGFNENRTTNRELAEKLEHLRDDVSSVRLELAQSRSEGSKNAGDIVELRSIVFGPSGGSPGLQRVVDGHTNTLGNIRWALIAIAVPVIAECVHYGFLLLGK